MIRLFLHLFSRRPTVWAAMVTLVLLMLTDLVQRGLSVDPYVKIGPHDGEGPFVAIRGADGHVTPGTPMATVQPGHTFAMVGDLTLTAGTAETAEIAFVCGDSVLTTTRRNFRPGERPAGAIAGIVSVPMEALGECEVTRTVVVVPWLGFRVAKKLRSVFIRVVP